MAKTSSAEWPSLIGDLRATKPRHAGGRHTLNRKLQAAITKLNEQGANLPDMWSHAASRHTFASQLVINGGGIEKLKEALGYSSVVITERHAHLRGDVFTPADLGRISVDLSAPQGKVLPIRGENLANGRALSTAQEDQPAASIA